MDTLGAIILHTGVQFVIGGAYGSLVDASMPLPRKSGKLRDQDAVLTFVEAAAQLLANAGLVAAYISRMKMLDPTRHDPAEGVVLALVLQMSQPNLTVKMQQLSNFLQRKLKLLPEDKAAKAAEESGGERSNGAERTEIQYAVPGQASTAQVFLGNPGNAVVQQ